MKKFKLIIALASAICVLCSSATVLAEPAVDSETVGAASTTSVASEPVSEPSYESTTESSTKDTTQSQDQEGSTGVEDLVPSDYDTTSEETTEKSNSVVATTKKPSSTTTNRRPTTTRRPAQEQEGNGNRDENGNRNENENEQQGVTIEEETLPEGAFYVYLERNNGTKRLKAVLTKPELVTEPDTPVREGFVFDGWYADAEFTKKWNFYTDLAQEGTVIYAKWVPDPSAIVYNVKVETVEGGTIEVNPAQASEGEPVMIVVNPNEGMRLVAGSVTVNGKSTDILSFTMPAGDAVVSARFEIIPEVEEEIEEKTNYLPFIIGGIAFLIAAGVVIFFIIRRRDEYAEDEIDENGTIIDDDTDKSWVDESIVVGDGFKDGEKVIGNFIPEDDFSIDEDEE